MLCRDAPLHKWELPNSKQSGGVLCMDNYDITNDGVLDLIVARDDGLIEIYGYDETDEPVLKYNHVSPALLSSKCMYMYNP